MKRALAFVVGILLCGARGVVGQEPAAAPRVLDDFDTLRGWTALPADGVALTIRPGAGRRGGAMRMDFDFHHHGGYAIAHKAIALDLPENYALSFWLRAEAPVNNLEVKLIDASGENVWWDNQRDFVFPRRWTKVTITRRHITFAWGPAGGGTLSHAAAI
ncbi:MAG: coagulation factor 5/8 type domain-containing protein, partial [Gemmatimonadaceae bacterium]|nr:coagulation factor 5/8 type domain-containing protein [Gemmatimonadaceae bacterium]